MAAAAAETSGLNNHMWATMVNRDGIVCAVAFSGGDRSSQWPGSRVISAQKASTATSFSLDSGSSSSGSGQANGLALSTANLLVGRRVGGVNVFGGGLGLYDSRKKVVGGLGASGDTSCADHNIAWRVRHLLKLDFLAGVGGSVAIPRGPTTSSSTSRPTRAAEQGKAPAASDIPAARTRPAPARCRPFSRRRPGGDTRPGSASPRRKRRQE